MKLVFIFGGITLAMGIVVLIAEDPRLLESYEAKSFKQKVEVKIPPPAEKVQPPEAAPDAPSADLLPAAPPVPMEALAATFQGQGSGPGIRSGSGSGSEEFLNQLRSQDRAPRVLARAPLDYPSQAKSKGIEGYVLFKALIGTKGEVIESKIVKSEPAGVFDSLVQESVQKWKFEAGMLQGKVTSLWITQKVRFELD